MDQDELVTIGRFARLSGVSVHTLRHYDDIGLLRPSEVDPTNGYRRYRRHQVRAARLVVALRGVGLGVEEVRRILEAPTDAEVHAALEAHRLRLVRDRDHVELRLRDVDRYLREGIAMPVVQSGCRPVQLKIGADDVQASVAFYEAALGLDYRIARRTAEQDRRAFTFGEYGRDDFYLLWVLGPDRPDRPGRANFSFLVDDLDGVFARASAAGATVVSPPHDAGGMPPSATLEDPAGNLVGLAQGWPGHTGCRPVQVKLPVDDLERSLAFYRDALDLAPRVAREPQRPTSRSFVFGEYGEDDFFLLWLDADPERCDHPGRSNMSFLVEDVDAAFARAMAAGGTEVLAPRDLEGMPRSAGVLDPDGNAIGFAQG